VVALVSSALELKVAAGTLPSLMMREMSLNGLAMFASLVGGFALAAPLPRAARLDLS
jgi:hypothetical protein